MVKLYGYSAARSAVKAVGAVVQTAAAGVATVAIALAGDPELAAKATALAAGHPWALGSVGVLVFAGRFLNDFRKHREPARQ